MPKPPLSTYIARSYRDESDLTRIVDLLNLCESVDRLEQGSSLEELRQEFDDPQLDPAHDTQLWIDASGLLIGFGQLWIPFARQDASQEDSGFLWFKVHPSSRNQGLEAAILAWADQRLRVVGRERGVQMRLRTGLRDNQRELAEFLKQQGFVDDRYFYKMARSLAEPLPEPEFPAGFTLRHVEGNQEAEAWVAMYNQTFIDHWEFHPMTVEQFEYYGKDPDYQPELDLIAIAPDGTFAAFCVAEICRAENDRSGRNEGWIPLLGTRRGFRHIGLGRAMLLAGLHRLKAAGVDTALLGVDSRNPSGALRLYESVGFQKQHTRTIYVRDVAPEVLPTRPLQATSL